MPITRFFFGESMCVFRVSGAHFDVDQFLGKSLWLPPAIFRAGEPRFPASQPKGPILEQSGFNLNVSDAEFSELHRQIHDAILFLRSNEKELVRLRDFPGVEGMCLDFGIEERDVPAQSETFPPELLFLLGRLGISLAFTLYPSKDA